MTPTDKKYKDLESTIEKAARKRLDKNPVFDNVTREVVDINSEFLRPKTDVLKVSQYSLNEAGRLQHTPDMRLQDLDGLVRERYKKVKEHRYYQSDSYRGYAPKSERATTLTQVVSHQRLVFFLERLMQFSGLSVSKQSQSFGTYLGIDRKRMNHLIDVFARDMFIHHEELLSLIHKGAVFNFRGATFDPDYILSAYNTLADKDKASVIRNRLNPLQKLRKEEIDPPWYEATTGREHRYSVLDFFFLHGMLSWFQSVMLWKETSGAFLDSRVPKDLSEKEWERIEPIKYLVVHHDNASATYETSNLLLADGTTVLSTSLPRDLGNDEDKKLYKYLEVTYLGTPGEQYPKARAMRRKIIMHVGPTNSGKTYHALVALSKAKTGIYCAPLRLLAHEVYSRLNAGLIGDEGIKRACNLLTGEESRVQDSRAGLLSCTVEMLPFNVSYDVGIIDEIQMIGDAQRGAAWTAALLGANCKELHLCGEEAAVEIVAKIVSDLGDELVVNRYERLSPLKIDGSLRSDLKKLRKGDCLVTFSRFNIYSLKQQIEDSTDLTVAIAYGGLPPELREEQARKFNAGEADVLVASDAVGMGLNLKIRRVIFETMHKFNGVEEVALLAPQVKQIGGRAGRFKVPSSPSSPEDIPVKEPNPSPDHVGLVCTLHETDVPLLEEAFNLPVEPISRAFLTPAQETYEKMFTLLPRKSKMADNIIMVNLLAQAGPEFNVNFQNTLIFIVHQLMHIPTLSYQDCVLFMYAPCNSRDIFSMDIIADFASACANHRPLKLTAWVRSSKVFEGMKGILHLRNVDDVVLDRLPDSAEEMENLSTKTRGQLIQALSKLESFHKCITLYLWLGIRKPYIFHDVENFTRFKRYIESKIQQHLDAIKVARVDTFQQRITPRRSQTYKEKMKFFKKMKRTSRR